VAPVELAESAAPGSAESEPAGLAVDTVDIADVVAPVELAESAAPGVAEPELVVLAVDTVDVADVVAPVELAEIAERVAEPELTVLAVEDAEIEEPKAEGAQVPVTATAAPCGTTAGHGASDEEENWQELLQKFGLTLPPNAGLSGAWRKFLRELAREDAAKGSGAK
jgi:hypothetical protein